MPSSPQLNTDEVVRFRLTSDGKAIAETVKVVSVVVSKSANRIPYARIVMLDGDMPEKEFPVSDSAEFKPGCEIEIFSGYGNDEKPIFTGIVIRHGIKITGSNESRLVIECRDAACKLTIGRKNANYVDMTDSDIIAKIISDHSGLSSDVEATSIQHRGLLQHYCTDWDFLLSRAEVNGYLVIPEAGKLSVKAPQISDSPNLKVTYGEDLLEFQADMDARYQLAEVKGVSWDPSTQNVVDDTASPATLNAQGDLESAELAKVLGLGTFRLQTPATMDKAGLKAWSGAQQLKSGLARIQGRMKIQGSAEAKVGGLIELEGVGKHFSGKVFVTTVNHDISDGNWLTEVEFGLAPKWFAENRDLTPLPASGLLPGIEGLQIGIVTKLDEDPAEQSRVQVSLPLQQNDQEGVWARLAGYYASSDIGAFFVPEIGDEVILGYLNNDPCHPIILGSLYSSNRKPPYDLTADNFIKAIVTRSELRIEFDDDKKVITVKTPGENRIVISDEDKSILLEDQNDNKVELSPDGITLDSPKDISITAKGKITIDAVGEVGVSSKADVKIAGLNIDNSADVGFVAKGNASAELSASGQTTVKGAMVMIN